MCNKSYGVLSLISTSLELCVLHSCEIALYPLCQSEATSGEFWLLLCLLCFSGSLLFGYTSTLFCLAGFNETQFMELAIELRVQ